MAGRYAWRYVALAQRGRAGPRRALSAGSSRTPRCYELLRSSLIPMHLPMRLMRLRLRTRKVIPMLSCVQFGRMAVGPGAPV